jgi:hypothetical protein
MPGSNFFPSIWPFSARKRGGINVAALTGYAFDRGFVKGGKTEIREPLPGCSGLGTRKFVGLWAESVG